MKSILTIASVAMLHLYTNAQPVVQSSNVSANFDAELYFAEVPDGFSPGPAGPNQTWNFSSIGEGLFLGTQQSITAATSLFASEFPLANYCYTMESAFADETMYFYYKLTPTVFEIYSLGYLGEVGEDFRENPRTYVTFPYTYGTVFTDTYKRTTDISSIFVTVTYDAYGTLIMPFGTFNNVVRQKTVSEGNTNYVWFNVNPFYPILQTSLEDASLGYIIDNTVLGVGDHSSRIALTTYPNPVENTLQIKVPDTITGNVIVSVSDLSGKTFLSQRFDASEISVDLQNLSAGLYVVKVSNETADFVSKIVKT
jgi:hypothetical protein